MLTEKDNKKLRIVINIVYLIAIIGVIYFFIKYAFFWTLPFLIAFSIALLVDPLIKLLVKNLKWKRGIASTLVVTVVLALLVFVLYLLSRTLFVEAKNILSNAENYLQYVINLIHDIPTKYGHLFDGRFSSILEELIVFIQNYDYMSLLSGSVGSGVLKYAGSFVTSLPSALVFLIVTIVATYFTAASFPIIKAFIMRQFSPKARELVLDVKFYFYNTIVKYLKSYLILMMITFAELSVFFLVFGFKPAITLAFFIAIVDILPILGVGTILIPWSVIELLLGHPLRALILIGMYLVITIVRQTLEPKVIGDHVGLLPIVTLFCIYIGLQLFGILGMFMFPITVIILKNLQDNGKIKIWK